MRLLVFRAFVAAGMALCSAASLAQEPEAELVCQSYCSPVKPGTPVIEVRWRLSPGPLAPADVRARLNQQSVDVTVYSDGFQRGLFANLPAVKPKAVFALRRPAGVALKHIPGLEKLTVSDVVTSRDSNRAARLRLFVAEPGSPESVVIRVEGVDPGMNYSWRVPTLEGGRTVVTCRAAICPVDRQEVPRAVPRTSGKKK
ncbi:MAG: hypothetical protein AAB225_24105 [Acidobacteriota bacterium]